MAVIMLLENEADKSDALIEAALDLSRLFGAALCCLDRSASLCGAPVAQAIRQATPALVDDFRRCDICLDRDTDACAPVLRQAAFIISQSALALERALAKGYGPVLLVPTDQEHCRLTGRALVVLDGSPSIARNLHRLVPLLRAAIAIEVVTLRGAALSDAERMVAQLNRHGIPGQTDVLVSMGASNDIDLRSECQRVCADYCLVGASRSDGRPMIGATAIRSLGDPPCPVIIAR